MNKLFSSKSKKNSLTISAKIRPALDLNRCIAKDIFESRLRPWDAIPSIKTFIIEHGHELPYDEYDEIAENVWIHITAYLAPSAKIEGPAIICGGARIGHFSTLQSSIIGSFTSIGELTTIKSSILFDKSKLYGHNHLCSSILGYESAVGIGSMIPDTRLDNMNVTVDMPDGIYISGRQHLGAVICDGVKIGASCIINPGSVIDVGSQIYPSTSVSGYVYPYSTVK